MTLKKYHQLRSIIVVITAIIFSQSLVLKNFFLPVVTVILSSLILLFFRRQVKDVIADERDYALAGKSASWAIQIYSWISVIAMFALYALKDTNPAYEPIAMTLAFSACSLMLIYSLIFNFINKIKFTKFKIKYIIFASILSVLLSIATLRIFSGEDNWVCQQGVWVKHGQPSFAAPTSVCK